jgi:hypothetical protein
MIMIGIFVALTAAMLLYWARGPHQTREASLGRMSTQWIVEHRNSTSSWNDV